MAIKGKSKGRGARSVTRGPKAVYTPVKKPLLAKREFWLVIAGILGVAIVGALAAGFIAQRNASAQDDLEARMRSTMSQYQGDVESILSQIGQAQPPSGFSAFAEFTKAVTDLDNDTPGAPTDPSSLRQIAGDTIDRAKSALGAFQEFYRRECAKARIDYVPMDTSVNFDRALMEYLLQRQRRF